MLKLKINLLYIILFTIFVTHKIKRHGKNFKQQEHSIIPC